MQSSSSGPDQKGRRGDAGGSIGSSRDPGNRVRGIMSSRSRGNQFLNMSRGRGLVSPPSSRGRGTQQQQRSHQQQQHQQRRGRAKDVIPFRRNVAHAAIRGMVREGRGSSSTSQLHYSPRTQNQTSDGIRSAFSNAIQTSAESIETKRPKSPMVTSGEVTKEDRAQRFAAKPIDNKYEEMKEQREALRRQYIEQGLIYDPSKPMRLEDAITFTGTCEDMCPEYERHQREFEKGLDKLEMIPGTASNGFPRVDHARAVKAFHRPAAGNEQPLPCDVRPPRVLLKTLHYLLNEILPTYGLREVYGFIRDRTRSIRQDFTLQNSRGIEAIQAHELIARYHILCAHELCEVPGVSLQQEYEQMNKVLQSLMEFYDDIQEEGHPPTPNEAEFRCYYILSHIFDPDKVRVAEQRYRPEIFNHPYLQLALKLQALVQRNNEVSNRGKRPPNTIGAQNLYSLFFKNIRSPDCPYLVGCILEQHFIDVRRSAIKAMNESFHVGVYPLVDLCWVLGFDSIPAAEEVLKIHGIQVINGGAVFGNKKIPKTNAKMPGGRSVWREPAISQIKQTRSSTVVEAKRVQGFTDTDIILNKPSVTRTTPILKEDTLEIIRRNSEVINISPRNGIALPVRRSSGRERISPKPVISQNSVFFGQDMIARPPFIVSGPLEKHLGVSSTKNVMTTTTSPLGTTQSAFATSNTSAQSVFIKPSTPSTNIQNVNLPTVMKTGFSFTNAVAGLNQINSQSLAKTTTTTTTTAATTTTTMTSPTTLQQRPHNLLIAQEQLQPELVSSISSIASTMNQAPSFPVIHFHSSFNRNLTEPVAVAPALSTFSSSTPASLPQPQQNIFPATTPSSIVQTPPQKATFSQQQQPALPLSLPNFISPSPTPNRIPTLPSSPSTTPTPKSTEPLIPRYQLIKEIHQTILKETIQQLQREIVQTTLQQVKGDEILAHQRLKIIQDMLSRIHDRSIRAVLETIFSFGADPTIINEVLEEYLNDFISIRIQKEIHEIARDAVADTLETKVSDRILKISFAHWKKQFTLSVSWKAEIERRRIEKENRDRLHNVNYYLNMKAMGTGLEEGTGVIERPPLSGLNANWEADLLETLNEDIVPIPVKTTEPSFMRKFLLSYQQLCLSVDISHCYIKLIIDTPLTKPKAFISWQKAFAEVSLKSAFTWKNSSCSSSYQAKNSMSESNRQFEIMTNSWVSHRIPVIIQWLKHRQLDDNPELSERLRGSTGLVFQFSIPERQEEARTSAFNHDLRRLELLLKLIPSSAKVPILFLFFSTDYFSFEQFVQNMMDPLNTLNTIYSLNLVETLEIKIPSKNPGSNPPSIVSNQFEEKMFWFSNVMPIPPNLKSKIMQDEGRRINEYFANVVENVIEDTYPRGVRGMHLGRWIETFNLLFAAWNAQVDHYIAIFTNDNLQNLWWPCTELKQHNSSFISINWNSKQRMNQIQSILEKFYMIPLKNAQELKSFGESALKSISNIYFTYISNLSLFTADVKEYLISRSKEILDEFELRLQYLDDIQPRFPFYSLFSELIHSLQIELTNTLKDEIDEPILYLTINAQNAVLSYRKVLDTLILNWKHTIISTLHEDPWPNGGEDERKKRKIAEVEKAIRSSRRRKNNVHESLYNC